MSDLFGNHIVGFPTRRLIYNDSHDIQFEQLLSPTMSTVLIVSFRKVEYERLCPAQAAQLIYMYQARFLTNYCYRLAHTLITF